MALKSIVVHLNSPRRRCEKNKKMLWTSIVVYLKSPRRRREKKQEKKSLKMWKPYPSKLLPNHIKTLLEIFIFQSILCSPPQGSKFTLITPPLNKGPCRLKHHHLCVPKIASPEARKEIRRKCFEKYRCVPKIVSPEARTKYNMFWKMSLCT